MRNKIVLVAEQDSRGKVAAVWRRLPNQKTAKPVWRNDMKDVDRKSAVFHGASETDIVNHIKSLPRDH